MALEPKAGSASEQAESHELRDMKRRFWFAAAVTVPLVVLSMRDVDAETYQRMLTELKG